MLAAHADELGHATPLVAALDHEDDTDGFGHQLVLGRHVGALGEPSEPVERPERLSLIHI